WFCNPGSGGLPAVERAGLVIAMSSDESGRGESPKRELIGFSLCCRPEGTPFEDGTFKLTIEFTEEYPNKPPTNRWSPTYDVSSILTSIQSLLDEPNPNSPANSQAAQLYQENKREYEKRVSAIVEQSWRDC
ncbi:hypothetical protein E2I00_007192, partial [Balaenoptera physalus]